MTDLHEFHDEYLRAKPQHDLDERRAGMRLVRQWILDAEGVAARRNSGGVPAAAAITPNENSD